MVFFLIGLGLCNEKDITVRGLEAVRRSKAVYLEGYTSVLGVDVARLEAFYEKSVTLCDRETVESGIEPIIEAARNDDVSFLVVGDPFGATTHTDLALRARQLGVAVEVIHNASIMNAVGCCGLQLYRFGQTISVCFFADGWRPMSFYEKIAANARAGLHTLCLLDIKVKEQSVENLARGRKIYEPPRYMSVRTALEQLLECEAELKLGLVSRDSLCVGLARVGLPDQRIAFGTVAQVMAAELGEPLHSLVLCGELQEMEREYVQLFAVDSAANAANAANAAGTDDANAASAASAASADDTKKSDDDK